ncbi:hypothetical protein BACCOP_03922 [Phocaeicola coprocola DSM 17136]|uniref:Uncharacterized protein n=1 Tax=Phocaeicola coprocola DSM 17136 TaxID=470145 RepID=B3JPG1_9BACT|nr:hypothetical protein BACCOP_03922 [Phocaeicola coprocola DSM 17136]
MHYLSKQCILFRQTGDMNKYCMTYGLFFKTKQWRHQQPDDKSYSNQ